MWIILAIGDCNDERLTINEELFELKIKSEKLKQREESLWLYENDD